MEAVFCLETLAKIYETARLIIIADNGDNPVIIVGDNGDNPSHSHCCEKPIPGTAEV
jgi:hypothetical protein